MVLPKDLTDNAGPDISIVSANGKLELLLEGPFCLHVLAEYPSEYPRGVAGGVRFNLPVGNLRFFSSADVKVLAEFFCRVAKMNKKLKFVLEKPQEAIERLAKKHGVNLKAEKNNLLKRADGSLITMREHIERKGKDLSPDTQRATKDIRESCLDPDALDRMVDEIGRHYDEWTKELLGIVHTTNRRRKGMWGLDQRGEVVFRTPSGMIFRKEHLEFEEKCSKLSDGHEQGKPTLKQTHKTSDFEYLDRRDNSLDRRISEIEKFIDKLKREEEIKTRTIYVGVDPSEDCIPGTSRIRISSITCLYCGKPLPVDKFKISYNKITQKLETEYKSEFIILCDCSKGKGMIIQDGILKRKES